MQVSFWLYMFWAGGWSLNILYEEIKPLDPFQGSQGVKRSSRSDWILSSPSPVKPIFKSYLFGGTNSPWIHSLYHPREANPRDATPVLPALSPHCPAHCGSSSKALRVTPNSCPSSPATSFMSLLGLTSMRWSGTPLDINSPKKPLLASQFWRKCFLHIH